MLFISKRGLKFRKSSHYNKKRDWVKEKQSAKHKTSSYIKAFLCRKVLSDVCMNAGDKAAHEAMSQG